MKRDKSGRTNGIPSRDSSEPSSATARVGTRSNVVQAIRSAVQPGIEETKRGTVVRNTEVINQRYYTRHCLDIGSQLGAREWMMQSGRSGESRKGRTETAQGVPCTTVTTLLNMISKFNACAAMSG